MLNLKITRTSENWSSKATFVLYIIVGVRFYRDVFIVSVEIEIYDIPIFIFVLLLFFSDEGHINRVSNFMFSVKNKAQV